MSNKALTIDVYKQSNGWIAEGTVRATNGNIYRAKVEISRTLRDDLTSGEDDEPEREEAVKELLDQLITIIENPILQPFLPASVKVTVKAIKATRRLIEQKKAGSMAAGFHLAKMGQLVQEGNEIICGAVRAQRLYGC